MAVTRKTVGSITVLTVSGEFTGGEETDRLREAIQEEASRGNTRLLLDLSSCTLMNSSGISVLVEAYRNYAGRQGQIRLCGLQQRMRHQLVTVRLLDHFGHHASEAEAIVAFAGSGASG